MRAFAVGIAAIALLVQPGKADPCAAAATLLNGLRYADAQKAYADILKVDPTQTCARKGLEKIAKIRADVTGHLSFASSLAMANDTAGAQQEKLAAFAIDPNAEALAATTTASNPFAEVRELKKAGQYQQAVAKLREIVKARPMERVPADLDDLTDPFAAAKALSRARLNDAAAKELEAALRAATPPARPVPDELDYLTGYEINDFVLRHQRILLALLIVAALLLLPVLRKRLHPHLHVEDLADPHNVVAGRGASLYLQQQLVALTRAQAPTVQFVTAPITQVTIPAAISSSIPGALGWVQTLLSTLSGVYWRRSLTLAGSLHPAVDGKGVGFTLVLSENKTILSSVSLWQSTYGTATPAAASPAAMPTSPNPSAYFDLAEPAAIWLLFQLLQLRFKETSSIRRLLGTHNWRSYAMNAAGIRALQRNPRRAENFFVGALEFDPGNSAARANLGVALATLDQPDRAFEQLRHAKGEAQIDGGTDDPVFYSASFRIATLYYRRDAPTGKLDDALKEITTLAQIMTETRNNAQLRPSADRERLLQYIAFALPGIEVMRIGVQAEMGRISPTEADQQLLLYRLHPMAEAQFNLACAYSILGRVTVLDSQKLLFPNIAMDHLRFALHLDPAYCREAESDPALTYLAQSRRKTFEDALAAAKAMIVDTTAAEAPPRPAPAPAAAPPAPSETDAAVAVATTAAAAAVTAVAAALASNGRAHIPRTSIVTTEIVGTS